MGGKLMESRAELSFRLDGDNEIEAGLLSGLISDFASLTKAVALEQDRDAYLKMNVTAFRSGSFNIDFSAISEQAETIATIAASATTVVALASKVIDVVKGCFEVKRHLNGEKAKEIIDAGNGKIAVKNKDGAVLIAPKGSDVVQNNFYIDNLVAKISLGAQENNPNGGYTISAGECSTEFSPSDAAVISRAMPMETTSKVIASQAVADLQIRNATFVGRAKWKFYLDKKPIDASIDDDTFLELFYSGLLPIKPDDYITATYQVVTELDGNEMELTDTARYTIIKVHDGVKHDFSAAQVRMKDA